MFIPIPNMKDIMEEFLENVTVGFTLDCVINK